LSFTFCKSYSLHRLERGSGGAAGAQGAVRPAGCPRAPQACRSTCPAVRSGAGVPRVDERHRGRGGSLGRQPASGERLMSGRCAGSAWAFVRGMGVPLTLMMLTADRSSRCCPCVLFRRHHWTCICLSSTRSLLLYALESHMRSGRHCVPRRIDEPSPTGCLHPSARAMERESVVGSERRRSLVAAAGWGDAWRTGCSRKMAG
jgi:hypothetical protein